MFITRHVTFNESKFPYTKLFPNQSTSVTSNLVNQTPSQITFFERSTPVDSNHRGPSTTKFPPVLSPTSSSHSVSSSSSSQHFPSHLILPTHPMITRAKADIFKPKTYLAVSQDLELANIKDALQDSTWFSAMKEEIEALQRNNT